MRSQRLGHPAATVVLAALVIVAGACATDDAAKARHLKRADALIAEGNDTEAILEYRNALQIDPRLGEARLKLADAYLRTHNPLASAEELLRAADVLPQRVDVQLRAASTLLAVREFRLTRKYADAALAADPNNVDALVIRALALAGLSEVGGALRDLESAIIARPADARPYVALGSIRAGEANEAEAERAFRRAVDTDPASMNARAALAFYLWAKRDLPRAQQVLEEAAARQPGDQTVNRLLALLLLSQRRDAEAEPPLKRLADAGDETSILVLGDLYLRSGRRDMGRAQYERLQPASPRHPMAVARLAALDYAAGGRDVARQRLDAELKRLPDNPVLLIAQARWLLSERRRPEAVQAARRAVAANERSAEARLVLGLAHAANAEDEEAVMQFREALQLDPRMTAADVELSRLMMRPGTTDRALEHAQAAVSSAPRDYAARLSFARALVASKSTARAGEELDQLLADYPRASAVASLYGELLRQSGDSAGARRHFDAALALDPADLPALTARMADDLQQNRAADARARIAAALKQRGQRAAILILAAELEHTTGDDAAAERYIRLAIDAEPSNARAYGQLAHLYVGMNRLEEGKQALQDFLARRPDSVPARTMIGLIQELQGRTDDAVSTYERIVTTEPRAPIAANNLAFIFLERGQQLERALQLAQDARQQLPGDPNIRDTLGWALFKNGMTEDAIHELERTVEADPRNAGYLMHLGRAYEKAGRPEKAHEAFDRALTLDPKRADAEALRTRLAELKKRIS